MSGAFLLARTATGGAATVPFPDVDTLRHVTTRTSALTWGETGVGTMVKGTARVSHEVRGFTEDLRLEYVNEHNTAPVLLRASLSVPGYRRVLFGGSETVTIPARGTVTSDVVPVKLRPGTTIWSQTYSEVDTTSPMGWQSVYDLSIDRQEWTAVGDLTGSGASAPSVLPAGWNLRIPTRILGLTTPDVLSVANLTDSIGQTMRDSWPLQVAMKADGAVTTYGRGGDRMYYMQATRAARFGVGGVSAHSVVLSQMGTNDLGDAITTEATFLEMWSWMAAQGPRIVQSTLLPFSTSTDGWATLANQTPINLEKRRRFNRWFRDGAPIVDGVPVAPGTVGAIRAGEVGHPLWKVIDVCPAIESSQDSGLWKTIAQIGAAHGDGLHPSKLGHDLIAAAIPANVYSFAA